MKKKNLIILLLLPFLIASFCIITINTTYNKIDVDISYIDWSYNDMEDFRISSELYPLTATGVNQRYYPVSDAGELVWSVENLDGTDTPYAEIVVIDGKSYLKTLGEGEVIITCSNKKGNVYRQMTGVVYKDTAILLYPAIQGSQVNIDPTVYYGEFDHEYGRRAEIEMVVRLLPETLKEDLIIETSKNISFDVDSGVIKILGAGSSYVKLSTKSGNTKPSSFSFEVVKDGVNVYTYDDLLNCTNRSEKGEIIVLRKNFESVENTYLLDSNGSPIISNGKPVLKSDNTVCFGNYNHVSKTFSFKDEIYSFKTTYNTKYIEQWNEFANKTPGYSEITDIINVGLRIQKDFYGNGFTINMHNLTYPYAYIPMTTDNGQVVRIPKLTADNLFRGPLKLYSLGDPNNVPLVSLYGQDNVGMYIDADNIKVNDVNLKNCDFGDRFANLSTTGTVLEVAGDNVIIENSKISNGKNVVRSFSSMDLTIRNCILSNAQNFLFVTGSNEYVPVDNNSMATFSKLDGTTQKALIGAFIAEGGEGDEILNQFLSGYFVNYEEKEAMRAALISIQNALNNTESVKGNYKGTSVIEDTYFYRSGISSICLDTQFNGAFLESASPSKLSKLFTMLEMDGKSIIPFTPKEVSGVSYPVNLTLTGDTRFYDYKTVDNIELGGLIEENITSIANTLEIYDGTVDIDTVFPMKSILSDKASNLGYKVQGQVNIPIAFYGGGANLSTVELKTDSKNTFSSKVPVDFLTSYLNIQGTSSGDLLDTFKGLILKTVTTVTGFEPFNVYFIDDGYLYGETPDVSNLKANAKENKK